MRTRYLRVWLGLAPVQRLKAREKAAPQAAQASAVRPDISSHGSAAEATRPGRVTERIWRRRG